MSEVKPMADIYRERCVQLEGRLDRTETQLAKLTVERVWLKCAVLTLLNGMDGLDISNGAMHDMLAKANLRMRLAETGASFTSEDVDKGEPSGDQFPIVAGRDLGRSDE